MKIEKLELKHICGYLPYALDIEILNYQCDYVGIKYSVITGCYHCGVMPHFYYEGGNTGKSFSEFKPLLLPLSALTEPLEDGTVPIVELAKILYNDISWTGDFKIKDNKVLFDSYESFNQFWYNEEDKEFFCEMYDMKFPVFSLKLFEYLYSKHFDIFDLISSGLAIDKRTVKV